ncbi:traB domain-containing protein-like isoform X2 [Salvia splendens]|uniref:traB domain-containing protein-like isoform X2 n=1 Tax=Salvia splendens TaxID=180675 RepID=UPI001C268BF6|nr:traB domain-containing protein-like isoform X2 [Salvia splendens]
MYGFANRLIPLFYAAAKSSRLLSSPAATAGTDRISDPHNNHERKRRKEEPLENVVTLTCESSSDGGVCNVYVIGSDHRSPKSWAEVKAVMQTVKPEAVFLELCASRRHILTHDKIEMPTLQDMVHMWKKNESLYSILFKRYVAKVPGGDFRTAYIEATKYGAKVILGDRPIEITTLRYWADTSLLHLYLNLTRPPYVMHSSISQSLLAVVGRTHVPGIQNNWKQHVEIKILCHLQITWSFQIFWPL